MGTGSLKAALSALRPGVDSDQLRAAAVAIAPGGPTALELASPWAPSHTLAKVLFADIFGTSVRPVTRAEGMAVPAYARARHVLCATVARYPLRAYRGDQVLEGPAAPPWVADRRGPQSAFHRMTWTVDDLLWYGWSCWSRTNVAPSSGGGPDRMARLVPGAQWELEADTGRVKIRDNVARTGWRVARPDEAVLIPGPHEGLLATAGDTIRHGADLQRAAHRAAKHPSAYLALVQQPGTVALTRDQRRELAAEWGAAREGENGGVAVVTPGIDPRELGTFDRHLVLDGRNAAAVDAARTASVPADVVDAAGPGSLTYANVRDNDRRVVDYGAGFYMLAIQEALSLDGVSPRGQRVAFDLGELLASTTPTVEPSQPPATPPVSDDQLELPA